MNEDIDNLSNNMHGLSDSLEAMNGQNTINVYDVLTDDFLDYYTDYQNVDALFKAAGITDEDIANYNQSPERLDKVAQDYAKFASFGDFLAQAAIEKQFANHGFDLN